MTTDTTTDTQALRAQLQEARPLILEALRILDEAEATGELSPAQQDAIAKSRALHEAVLAITDPVWLRTASEIDIHRAMRRFHKVFED